jgi:hypothetical protein
MLKREKDESVPRKKTKRTIPKKEKNLKTSKKQKESTNISHEERSIHVPHRRHTRSQSPSTHQLFDRNHFFAEAHKKLVLCPTWFSLCKVATDLKEYLYTTYRLPKPVVPVAQRKRNDKTAQSLYPSDAPTKLLPQRIYGDGNCLPRVFSLFCFGHENNHIEMRVRVVVEQALFIDHYLNESALGIRRNTITKYAMYSDQFTQGDTLDSKSVRDIYEYEVLSIIDEGTYMGIWQLHAFTSVVQCFVQSIYPTYGGGTVRRDLHKLLTPREQLYEEILPVMWTNTGGDNIPEVAWKPNHFVPCCKSVTKGKEKNKAGKIFLLILAFIVMSHMFSN